jgi:hypothetical protein
MLHILVSLDGALVHVAISLAEKSLRTEKLPQNPPLKSMDCGT